MTEKSYLVEIPAAAISDACRDAVSIIINNHGDNSLIQNLEVLYPQGNYKVYYTEPGIGQLNEVLSVCHECKIPAIVLCGEDCSDISDEDLIAGSSVSLISPGSGFKSDITLERLLSSERISVFTHMGWQNYRYNPKLLNKTRERCFEELRLGLLRKEISVAEPHIRSNHHIFLDMNAIRSCDFPDNIYCSPNGLYAEEICQLARYIGMGQNFKTLFLYGYPSKSKPNPVTLQLLSEILWHISEALSSNISEDPSLRGKEELFLRKIVSMGKEGQDLVFVNSSSSGRWWMQIPEVKVNDSQYVACSYTDYITACNGEIPLRWLFFYQKFNND